MKLEVQGGVVDDVLATGGTLYTAAELASRAGYSVVGFLTLIDLQFLNEFSWHNKSVYSLVQYAQ